MIEQSWRVRLGTLAELDFANIISWTAENFGPRQARIYRDTLLSAVGELSRNPRAPGSKGRDDIMPGLRTLHVARRGRRGRHLLLYRIRQGHIVEIGRILHDQMELELHLPFSADEERD